MAHTWSMNCFWGLNGGYSRLNSIWGMVSPFSLKLGFVDRLRRIQHWVFVLVSTLPGTASQLFWIQPKVVGHRHHFCDLDLAHASRIPCGKCAPQVILLLGASRLHLPRNLQWSPEGCGQGTGATSLGIFILTHIGFPISKTQYDHYMGIIFSCSSNDFPCLPLHFQGWL